MPHGPQIAVQFVHQGHAGRDLQFQDIIVGDSVEIFDERAQAVSVRGDDPPPALPQGRD